MIGDAGDRTARAVLLADDDAFECGYVETVLTTRGIAIVGPFDEPRQALEAVNAPGLGAAVIGQSFASGSPECLASALDQRGIPYLTLAKSTGTQVKTGPTLRKPFAGYQVADWVISTLDGK